MTGIDVVVIPRAHDIRGFEVRRALPSQQRQMVGPFIFFDQIGPGEFLSRRGLDVPPHPHIGLATITYLFDRAIQHRDTLGFDQAIVPGDVNWMTAGRGIAHSERTNTALRGRANRLYGIQSWVALPQHAEEMEPAFAHRPAASQPVLDEGGMRLRLVVGEAWGLRAPAATSSPLFYADVALACGAAVPLPDTHEERAAYLLDGEVEVAGERAGERHGRRVPLNTPVRLDRQRGAHPGHAARQGRQRRATLQDQFAWRLRYHCYTKTNLLLAQRRSRSGFA